MCGRSEFTSMINLIREENRQTVQQGNHFIGLLAFNAYPFGREEYENKWFEKGRIKKKRKM